MNRETLKKINALVSEKDTLKNVWDMTKVENVKVMAEYPGRKGIPTFTKDFSIAWDLIKPIVETRYDQIVKELKNLGYEEEE